MEDTIITAQNTPHGEMLLAPMMMAAFLRQIEPVPKNAFHHFVFLAKVHPQFHELLHRRDEKSIWLYGYWSGLMCRFERLWWSRERSKKNYEAIRLWLHELNPAGRPGLEGAMWAFMMDELNLAPTFRSL